METIALTLVLFLAVVLILVPAWMMADALARKLRSKLQLQRMRRRWIHYNRQRAATGISRPFTAIMAATTTLRVPTHASR